MRILGRWLGVALALFIAGILSPAAHAQTGGADYTARVRQTQQLVQRWAAIERRLQEAFEACDKRRFDRALVELRVLQDVVETINRREIREDRELREEAKRVGARESVFSQPLDESRLLSFAGSLRLWQERGRELERKCGPRTARSFDPSRNHVSVFLEGGASFGHSTLAVDPGAFVPVNETLGSGQGFVGGSIEVRSTLNLLNRNIAYQLGSFPLGSSSGGFTFRLFDDGDRRNFDAPPVAGEVRHAANWSVTGYIGFPQVIQQPTGLPFQALIITPTVGVTYQEDTLKSVQTSGGVTNTFEKTFGRMGATVGLNFEVPAGNFSYGLTTGLTMLPSTTVNGISSLGLPAQAKIDSQANFFVGGRVGVRLFETDAIFPVP